MDEKTKAFEELMNAQLADKEAILKEETKISYYEYCEKCKQSYITGTIHICPTWTKNKK